LRNEVERIQNHLFLGIFASVVRASGRHRLWRALCLVSAAATVAAFAGAPARRHSAAWLRPGCARMVYGPEWSRRSHGGQPIPARRPSGPCSRHLRGDPLGSPRDRPRLAPLGTSPRPGRSLAPGGRSRHPARRPDDRRRGLCRRHPRRSYLQHFSADGWAPGARRLWPAASVVFELVRECRSDPVRSPSAGTRHRGPDSAGLDRRIARGPPETMRPRAPRAPCRRGVAGGARHHNPCADGTDPARSRSSGRRDRVADGGARVAAHDVQCTVAEGPDMTSVSGTEGYAEEADDLFRRYKSVSFAELHRSVLHLIPPAPCWVLDIGSGTGRAAAALAAMGHRVVALEPTDEMRMRAVAHHPSRQIEWLDDRLPGLTHALGRGKQFDVIMMTAVWMHLDQPQRRRAR